MLNDDLIGAYLDGELDAEKRALVDHWLATDPGAAARLELLRGADAIARRATPSVAPMADDPIAAMIMATPSAKIISLREKIDRPWVRQVAAMAAACVIGVLGGRLSAPQVVAFSPSMQVGNDLQQILDRLPSGAHAPIVGGEVQMALSVRTDSGQTCRQFRVTSGATASDALACVDGGHWRTVVQAIVPAEEIGYSTAGAEVSPIEAAMLSMGNIAVLSGDEESALIASHWASEP